MKASFRTVVLGDSVAWGQGLLKEQKFHSIVAQELAALARRDGLPEVLIDSPKVFAHSGAVIHFDPDKEGDERACIRHMQDRFEGELPLSYPSITHQVDRILEGDGVDLVMLTAGANDLNLFKVVDVELSEAAFRTRVEALLHRKLWPLLSKIGRKCGNATIVLCGYYKPVSEQSHSPLLDPLLDQLNDAKPNGLRGLDRLAEISRRGDLWMELSVACLTAAIASAVADEPSLDGRIHLAVPRWDNSNAVFGPMTKLWALGSLAQAQDPFSQLRNDEFMKFHQKYHGNHVPDWKAIQVSRRGSAGHPNPAGAQRYAEAIQPLLPAIWKAFKAR